MRALTWAACVLGAGLAWPLRAAEVVAVASDPQFAHPGQVVVAQVRVSVAPGFHVQANPVRNRFLIPIVLAVKPDTAVTPGAPVYPVAKTMRLEGSDEDLVIYDGEFEIRLPLHVADNAPAKRLRLTGTLRYQACDDHHCLFPTTVPLELSLEIKER